MRHVTVKTECNLAQYKATTPSEALCQEKLSKYMLSQAIMLKQDNH